MTKKYYTVKEVAEYLGVTTWAVYKWIERGRIEAHLLGEKKGYRFTKKQIEDFEIKTLLQSGVEEKEVALVW